MNDASTTTTDTSPDTDAPAAAPTALMIDAPTTRDRDDAFTVTRTPTGGWTLTVHIADVAHTVPIGSDPDWAALERAETLYRPRAVEPMLGHAIEATTTLTDTAPRRAMTITITLAADGEPLTTDCSRTTLQPSQSVILDYESAEAALNDPTHPHHQHLATAAALSNLLLARRRGAGALAFYDLGRGLATNEDGILTDLPTWARVSTYVLVAELMIAANSALAEWATTAHIPIVYRNHRRAPAAPDIADIAADILANSTDPTALAALRRRLQLTAGAADYAPVVHGHYGLALAAYTHATSPLRRYVDLLTQRQVLAHIDGTPLPYTADELTLLTDRLNATLSARRAKSRQFFHDQRAQEIDQIVETAAYQAVEPKQWRKALAVAVTAGPPHAALLTELRRRAHVGEITLADAAAIATAPAPEWAEIRGEIYKHLYTENRPASASIAAIIGQTTGEQFTTDTTAVGPPHDPQFTTTATHAGHTGPARTASSRKVAEQEALWALLADRGDVTLPTPEPTTGTPTAAAAPIPASSTAPANQTWASEKQWRKVLAAATELDTAPESVLDELAARAAQRTLSTTDLALLLGGRGRAWIADYTRTHVDDALAAAAPSHAVAALIAAIQHGTLPASCQYTTSDHGDPHTSAPDRFAATATSPDGTSATGLGATKKQAEQAAAWKLIGALLGN